MRTKIFVQDSLFYINVIGLNPEDRTISGKVRLVCFTAISITFIVLIALEMIVNWNGIDSMLEGLDACIALLELKVKVVIVFLWRKKIIKLLDDLELFWPEEELSEEEIRGEIKPVREFVRKCIRALKMCYWSTSFLYALVPLLGKERRLTFEIYEPFDISSFFVYYTVYFLQVANAVAFTVFMLGFDYLFIVLMMHIYCELKLVKCRFRNLKIYEEEERNLKGLYELVKHHDFVLQFIRRTSDFYSLVMLSNFLVSTFCICLGLLSMTREGFPPSLGAIFRYGLYLASYSAEIYIYCYGGNVVSVESASIADAVYNSKWWIKTQPKFRRAVAFVIRRAQNGDRLTAGGMFELSLESFTSVMNTGMSFFTLMQAMYKEDKRI